MEKFEGTLLEWLDQYQDDAYLDEIDNNAYYELDKVRFEFFRDLYAWDTVAKAKKQIQASCKHEVVQDNGDPFHKLENRPQGARGICRICGKNVQWLWFDEQRIEWSQVGWKEVEACE